MADTITASTLAGLVERIMPEVVRLRRELHQHPELSNGEERTAARITSLLEERGIRVQRGIGGHGLVAHLESHPEHEWIALRADMDALPIHDGKQACKYASRVDGVSHACGHDAHSAMLVGATLLLHGIRDALPYNIACIFQPAEETTEGAAAMLEDGLFDRIKPKRIHALHVYPYLPAGSIGLRDGIMCAAADMFEVEVIGRGGHAARPHECTDVILIASHIIQALHHIIGRRVNPMHPAVLTIGQIQAGHAANVMPERLLFSGTLRSLHADAHEEIRARMDHIIRQTAETWGATAHFHMRQSVAALHNDEAAMQHVRECLHRYLPETPTIDIGEPSMGGEDFAEFLRQTPGTLLRLGTGADPATRYPLHHPNFDIHEPAMATGLAALVSLCLK